jgi:hypothetical protein
MERIGTVCGGTGPQAHARPAVIEKFDSRLLERRDDRFDRSALAQYPFGAAILHGVDRLGGHAGAFGERHPIHRNKRPRRTKLISCSEHF